MIAGLPYDAEVEYIESTGTQYIVLDFLQASVLRIVTMTTITNGDGSEMDLVGNQDDTTGRFVLGVYGNKIFGYSRNGANNDINVMSGTILTNTIYNIECVFDTLSDTKKLVVNGQEFVHNKCTNISNSQSKVTVLRNTLISGSPSAYRGALYALCLFKDESKWYDLIPVRFTNELGQSEGAMYDRVSRKLFRNAGTGAFTIGPDVATPVMGLHFMPKPKLTARDYVQDGLIAMWDGIENAGAGVHDANATTWVDLIGGIELSILAGGTWGDSYLETDGANLAVQQSSNSLSSVFADMKHFQTAFSVDDAVQSMESKALIHYRESLQNGKLRCGVSRITGRTCMGVNQTIDVTATDETRSYACSSYPNAGTVDGVWVDGQPVSMLGTYSVGEYGSGLSIGGNNNGSVKCAGRVYCLRIYSRSLTDQEIAANYAIDKERFNLP